MSVGNTIRKLVLDSMNEYSYILYIQTNKRRKFCTIVAKAIKCQNQILQEVRLNIYLSYPFFL